MTDVSTGNRLLDSAPVDDLRYLRPHLERIALVQKQTINKPGLPIEHIYFPTEGVISLIASLEDGSAVEVGIIGREGMAGIPVLLGTKTASNEAFVQINGSALRMPTGILLDRFDESRPFRQHMLRFAQALSFQISQSAACNARHGINERCARWLLQAHDRVEGNTFTLTHEFLGIMLGVRRSGVTVAAGALQQAGFIRYKSGEITILDREGLESVSCQCYATITNEYTRLLT